MSDESVKVSIIANVQGLVDGLKTATSGVKDATNQMEGSFKGLSSVIDNLKAPFLALTGIVAGGAMFKAAMTATADWNMEVNKLSKTLNISVQEASAWAVMLHTLGVSSDDLTGIIGKLQARVASNTAEFKRWGVQTKDAHGGALPMSEVIQNMATKYQSLNTDQERNTMLQALAGRGWLALLPIMRATTACFAASKEEAEKLHLIVGKEGVAKTREYQESMRQLDLIQKSLQIQVGDALMPVLTKLGTWLGDTGPTMAEGMAIALKGLITGFFAFKASVEITTSLIYTYLAALWDILKTLAEAWWKFNTLDFKGAFNALKGGWHEFKNDVTSGYDSIKTAITGAVNASKDLWKDDKKKPGTGETPSGKNPVLPGTGKTEDPEAKYQRELAARKRSLDEIAKLENQAEKEKEARARQEEDAEIEAAKDIYEKRKDYLEQEVAAGRMSISQETAELKKAIQIRAQMELAAVQKHQNTINMDFTTWKKFEDQKIKIARKAENDITKLETKSLQARAEKYKSFFSTISHGFSSTISGLIQGTTTWGDAVKSTLGSMLDSVIQFFVDWGVKELETIATTSAAHTTANKTAVIENATEAGTGAMKSASSIPMVGWAIAIGAGLAVFAAAKSMSSASGGWDRVPSDQLAMIHKDEMVLPANLAEGARQTFAGGGGGNGTTIHIHTVDAKGLEGMLQRNQGALLKVTNQIVKNRRKR